MIPELSRILAMLMRAECTTEQALAWISEHIAFAVNEAADRDGFAMQAMNALMLRDADMHREDIADDAYAMADKMMTARNL